MPWTIKYADSVKGQMRKIDKQIAREIVDYMDDIAKLENPGSKGKSLQGALGGLWRYRMNDWRIICDIQHTELIVLVLRIGHRKNIYGGH